MRRNISKGNNKTVRGWRGERGASCVMTTGLIATNVTSSTVSHQTHTDNTSYASSGEQVCDIIDNVVKNKANLL